MKSKTDQAAHDSVIVYFAWAENSQGQIEQLRVERGKADGFNSNPHKAQTWTGRIFKNVREAAAATLKLNTVAR
jgi:hypothetical protein